MKKWYFLILGTLLSQLLKAQSGSDWVIKTNNPEFLHRTMKHITDVIVHDIYSPPVASRIYAYVSMAGYECEYSKCMFGGKLHNFSDTPKNEKNEQVCQQLSSINAMLLVAKSLVISEDKIEEFRVKIFQEFKQTGIPNEVFISSELQGQRAAEKILLWASLDNYKQTRSLPKYAVSKDLNTWKPTSPSYMKAIEPHWSKLRTFLIDSAQQFRPQKPSEFSTDKESECYKQAVLLVEKSKNLSSEEIEIANFWDCNPFKMNIKGHVMFATKKISPGGHWINITGLACKKKGLDFHKSMQIYTTISLVIADSFISCWDEKYRSNAIRPETYINQYLDKNWSPLLQTPPFPEYTSGHSVVSGACAIVLTKYFGENFEYVDSTEVEFGIPIRAFKSFKQAAQEASISRFYGGIHFMPALMNGLKQGEDIGNYYLKRLNFDL